MEFFKNEVWKRVCFKRVLLNILEALVRTFAFCPILHPNRTLTKTLTPDKFSKGLLDNRKKVSLAKWRKLNYLDQRNNYGKSGNLKYEYFEYSKKYNRKMLELYLRIFVCGDLLCFWFYVFFDFPNFGFPKLCLQAFILSYPKFEFPFSGTSVFSFYEIMFSDSVFLNIYFLRFSVIRILYFLSRFYLYFGFKHIFNILFKF